MRLDFHTHGKLAKKLPFSTAYTDWLFGEARRAGLDALCLTEHFNTLQFADLYGYLSSISRRVISSKGSLSTATAVTRVPGEWNRVPRATPAVVPPLPQTQTVWSNRTPAASAWP